MLLVRRSPRFSPLFSNDWTQNLALYQVLLPSIRPVVRLNRRIALRYVLGSAEALAEVERLQDSPGFMRPMLCPPRPRPDCRGCKS